MRPVCLIISPLRALAESMTKALADKGINACLMGATQRDLALAHTASKGHIQFIVVVADSASVLVNNNVQCVLQVFDECHELVNTNFRKSYTDLPRDLSSLFVPHPHIVGLTGTCSELARPHLQPVIHRMSSCTIGALSAETIFAWMSTLSVVYTKTWISCLNKSSARRIDATSCMFFPRGALCLSQPS